MKKLILITLLISAPCFAGGPKETPNGGGGGGQGGAGNHERTKVECSAGSGQGGNGRQMDSKVFVEKIKTNVK